jgi:hypothetical protein
LTWTYRDRRYTSPKSGLKRYGIIPVEFVFNPLFIGAYNIYHKSIKILLKSNFKCEECGMEGKYFAIESWINGNAKNSINMYGINKEGKEVQLTVDHIIPLSKGGGNNYRNLQILCFDCNQKKADTIKQDVISLYDDSNSKITIGDIINGSK